MTWPWRMSFAPDLTYWPGILMVFAGSAYLLWSERAKLPGPVTGGGATGAPLRASPPRMKAVAPGARGAGWGAGGWGAGSATEGNSSGAGG